MLSLSPFTKLFCPCNDAFTGRNCGLHFLLSISRLLLFTLLSCFAGLFLRTQLLDWLADDLHEVLLESLLLKDEAILVPDEVGHLGVPTVLLHAAFEQPEHVLVIGVLGELELSAVVHELAELFGVALAQLVHGDLELLLLDIVVLFILRPSRETLPRETAAQEVQQYVPDCLEVVTARLLVTNVRVDARIPRSTRQVLPLSERNVLPVRVLVALGETEINDVDIVLAVVITSNQEVIRLDVSVDDAFLVDLLDALNLFNHICVINFHTIWIAMHRTVLRSNLRLHSWNRSSRLLPRRSITMT